MSVIDNAALLNKMRQFVMESRRHPGAHFFGGPPPESGGEFGPPGMRPPGPPPGVGGEFGPPGTRPPGPQHRHGGHRRNPLSRERLLVVINQHPDGIRQKALSEKLGIGQSSVSELVNKLESDGYLERRIDQRDKRATLLFLTELGQARAYEVAEEREELFRNLFSSITEEEKQVLSGLLDKLLAGLGRQDANVYMEHHQNAHGGRQFEAHTELQDHAVPHGPGSYDAGGQAHRASDRHNGNEEDEHIPFETHGHPIY